MVGYAATPHDFARAAILDALALDPAHRLLEVGCGGGLLLRDALVSGAAATGLDHSPQMVEPARSNAVGAGLLIADAERLPFLDAMFTAVAVSVVFFFFFFFPRPLRVLHECGRVLAAGGRLAVYTTGRELRGTPAAPEPIASRGHVYEDAALASLAGGRRVHRGPGGQPGRRPAPHRPPPPLRHGPPPGRGFACPSGK